MKKTVVASLAICALLVMSFPLSAQGADFGGKIRKANYVTAKVGAYFPTADLNDMGFEGGPNVEFAVGRHLNDNVALEFGLGFFQSEGETGGVTRDVVVVPVTATAKYVIPIEVGEAYFGAGGGIYWAKLEQKIGIVTTRDNGWVLGGHLVGGANVDVAKDMFVSLEGKWIFTDNANLLNQPIELSGASVTGNFGYRF